ncbi:uncharacterized protein LOC128232632 [Mya arenaria]|uniref:uncharacterized protein LOC128232632 n=1 Tax=Mya arenaria TaxID=6604 RepID=UPI0022E803A2|nr:uncharacterized protein LOC128232632 [Mya arenaria]XP_052802261.1 uncharacterized protein LOC128232632 [Mya arenaria]XP_052802262.1 uncharacterized protein LOC128232632 [Mya arenaria]
MKYWLLLIAIVQGLFTSLCRAECKFPDFLQTYGDGPSWFIRYPGNKDVSITVKYTHMYIKECQMHGYRSCKTYERNCNVDKGGYKFLVREILSDINSYERESTYRCIQFIRRSKSVVQIKVSRYMSKNSSETLCNDEFMNLDLNPMISREHAEEENQCPIVGGYDFKLYAPDQPAPLCDDIFLPLRIESDCTQREGIKLYFRRRNCSSLFVGRPIESDPVRLRCVATWRYMQYTFSIVKWHGSSEFWCFRVLYKENDVQEIYIYFNGICPFDDGKKERMLMLKHFKIHHVTNICEDENLVCSYHHCSTRVRDNCKLSCSLCEPEKEERPCSFPSEFHGFWNGLDDPVRSVLIIDNQTLTYGSLKWHCVTSTTSETLRRRKVLKLKFNNGCHPRYTCVDIEQPAESVLRYRTGTELHWPIQGLEEVCEDRYFDYVPTNSHVTGIARTSGPWIYFINDSPKFVTCNLPWYIPKASFYDMYDRNNNLANHGCLLNSNGHPGHVLQLYYTYKDIDKEWKVHIKKTFICLASIRFIGENDVLITQNVDEGIYMCWSFYRDHDRNYVYIFGAKDCGNGTNMQLVHYSAKKALATLVLMKNSTECDFIEYDQDKAMTRRSDDALSNLTENNVGSSSNSIISSFLALAFLIQMLL